MQPVHNDAINAGEPIATSLRRSAFGRRLWQTLGGDGLCRAGLLGMYLQKNS